MSTSPQSSVLPASWEVPELFRRRLGTRTGRQRAMEADGHLLLLLHAPPQPDDDQRRGRLFWLDPQGQWRSTEQGAGLAALQRHVSEYGELMHKLDDRVDNASSSQEYFAALEELAPLQRAARNMHRVLQDARKLKPDCRELIDVRDEAYAIERSAELLYADATNSLQFTVALQSERQALAAHQMAVSSHRLNMLAAVFFPVATLSAVFGVNLKHTWEETAPPWPFLALLGAGLLMGAGLVSFMLRPTKEES